MKNSEGIKVAQTKVSKKVHSANIREKRIQSVVMGSKFRKENICYECGFHIRGKNHLEGAHHNSKVASCHR